MTQTSKFGLTLFASVLIAIGTNGLPINGITPSALAQATSPMAANQLLQQGIEQLEAGQAEKALQTLEQALLIARQNSDRPGEGEARRNIGRVYYQLKDFTKAFEQFEQSLTIAREVKNRRGEGRSLSNLGTIYEKQNNLEKAIEQYQQGVKIAQEVGDRKGEGISQQNIGWIYITQNKYPQSIEQFQTSLAIWRELKERSLEADSLEGLGNAHKSLGENIKAIAYYEQQLTLKRELKNRKGESSALSNLGMIYYNLKDYDKSITFYHQSLAINQELKDQDNLAIDWRNVGILHTNQKDYPRAIAALQQALDLNRQLNRRQDEGANLTSMGIVYFELKEYQKSIEYHQQSLAIDHELNNRAGAANSLRNLGLAYKALGDLPNAFRTLEQSLNLRDALNDQTGHLALLETLAGLAYEQKDYQNAIKYYERNLRVARERQALDSEGVTLRMLGASYSQLKKSKENSEKSIEYSTAGLKLAEKMQDKQGMGKAFRELGIRYMHDNRFPLALENFQKSLTLWRDLANPEMEANVLSLLGALHGGSIGKDGESWCPTAIDYYEKSLTIVRRLKKPGLESEILNGLSHCYEVVQDYQKAIEAGNQSLTIARQAKDALKEGLALAYLGKSYQAIGNLPQAQQSTEQGLAILHSIQDHQWEVFTLDRLASIYVASAQHQKAIEMQTQKIVIAQKYNIRLVERSFNAIFVKIAKAKEFDYKKDARDSYVWQRKKLEERGFRLGDLNLSEANISDFNFYIRDSFIGLGDAYSKSGDYPKALVFYQSALTPDFDKGYSSSFMEVELLGKLGSTYMKMERLPEAEAMVKLALKYGEEFRSGLSYSQGNNWTDTQRIALAEQKDQDFQQFQQILVRQNRRDEALVIAEEARARTFIELLAARIGGEKLGDKLPPAPDLTAIRQIAKTQNATLVQYSIVSPELLYIWVIKPTGEVSFHATPLDAKQPIKNLVTNGRNDIGVRGRIEIVKVSAVSGSPQPDPQDNKNLARLHQLLIDPIAADLPTDPTQRVIFLPQGPLFLVPFAALPDRQGQYLIERHTISTAPSIQTLELTRSKAKQLNPSGRALVVGDPTMPVFGGSQLGALSGARKEAIAIGNVLNITPLLGSQATKSAVLQQMQNASLIHLATHGLLDKVKGDIPGAIALAPSGQDNGLLSASEIFDLKLNASLVVLSACDSGRGNITGDGVVGLSRSLIAAGVPSVVVSLWAVNDSSTSVLMSEFYRNLKTKPDKAQALRTAMLTTMKRYPNPNDWAAFTLVGESE
jgi:CHAT domain-containing protein/Tfp pilus assembly protein PilF